MVEKTLRDDVVGMRASFLFFFRCIDVQAGMGFDYEGKRGFCKMRWNTAETLQKESCGERSSCIKNFKNFHYTLII